MELGKVKDRLDAILDEMDEVDPKSEEYGILLKRADDMRWDKHKGRK